MTLVLLESIIVVLFDAFLYPRLVAFNEYEQTSAYELLLDEEFPLFSDFKRYSETESNHAKRVSKLAGICGREIGVNDAVCAIGGMYYRIGKMLGKPEIDNAVKTATDYCFPPEIIAILEEYEGKRRLPQTPESAIVQMVNALVTKRELLDQNTMSNSWNEDMVIYQTLNEYSNTGIYDESGISMNQFLRIREKLVQVGIFV